VETLMDEIDQAQAYSDDFQAFALRQQQVAREPANSTGLWCLDCEEVIPEKRRAAVPGCRRCIDCQQTFETMEA
jgi:phage/conjugal plasmid C-4 type zinc finger TraR family protein